MSAKNSLPPLEPRLNRPPRLQRNGVLVYLNLAARAIEIVPNHALAERVPPPAWAAACAHLADALQAGHYAQGLSGALNEVTALLEQHFPAHDTNEAASAAGNELPDAVVLC